MYLRNSSLGLLTLLLVVCTCDVRAQDRRFNFKDYDSLPTREERNEAATTGLMKAFPQGTNVQPLIDFVIAQHGYCQKRFDIPETEGMQHLYCEVGYQDPAFIVNYKDTDTNGWAIRVSWSVAARYDPGSGAIRQLKVFWAKYSIGG